MELFNTVALYYFYVVMAIFVLYDCLLLYLLRRSYRQDTAPARLSYQEAKIISDQQLPVVTVLLPMYREALVPPFLFRSIANIDYPKDKLDVRILIEDEDKETLESIKYLEISNKNIQLVKSNDNMKIDAIKVWNRILINIDYVTEGIRTKPNALNIGLRHAKGKIVCVYDAEDRPEEKQVRTCVAYIMKHPDVACVQARLAYYNDNQSMLTRLFAIEYNFQYFVSLPTYFSLNNIILLGGTSNFFRIESLKLLGGWDPKNVTEDADLGIRMARNHLSIVPI